jgi:gamma-glutamyl hercynylcysteine S-oxide synthase
MLTKNRHGRPWWFSPFKRRPQQASDNSESRPVADTADVEPVPSPLPETTDLPALVANMLTQERYALLLRRQIAEGLSGEQYGQAYDALERSMAPVPAGVVDVGLPDSQLVESHWLDRYPVTNRQFRQFREAGGYELAALWEAEVWPAVGEFVDLTGAAGPRFWRSGRYASGEDDHPVVGLNWYEAAAYARWAGKRLPSEAEWIKAAAWPIALSDGQHWQRQFPWGDTMQRDRCNVWGSGPGRTTEVKQFSSGVSVGGVYQLIGNVWEWTSGNFEAHDVNGAPLELPGPMKSIRGGAFDTYFEQQATCRFRSGEQPLARKHNIGFRCALGQCDVARWLGQSLSDAPAPQDGASPGQPAACPISTGSGPGSAPATFSGVSV